MQDDLFLFCHNMRFVSREAVYTFLDEKISKTGDSYIKNALYEREAKGSIQIEDGVVLPHIEDPKIKKTVIIIIPLKQPIKNWSATIKDIDLIICLSLCPIDKEEKVNVSNFVRTLADKNNINKLKQLNNASQIEDIS